MPRFQDLAGQTFGSLTVIKKAEKKGRYTYWLCHCRLTDRITEVRTGHLNSGHTTSARTKAEAVSETKRKHGHSHQDKGQPSKTYNSWRMMIRRCTDENHSSYPRYGGRGISVCDKWLESFENFLEDLGARPEGTTLDRIDNDLGYFKENCKWSTPKEQANNRRKAA